VDKTLAELELQLGPAFFRTHRGFLVNLSRIGEIVPGDAGTFRIILKDEAKTQLPLSRRQAQKLREIIPW
jgi:DNA-binding LytR/AlgR family response regulator